MYPSASLDKDTLHINQELKDDLKHSIRALGLFRDGVK